MQLAREKGIVKPLVEDMQVISRAVSDSKELENLLNSPLVKTDKKRTVLAAIFKGKVNDLSLTLIDQAAKQKREASLKNIADHFVALYRKENNIATVTVRSARPLDAEAREKIIREVKSTYNFSEIELTEKVDESLIGGIVLRIGDKQIDGSIKRKLKDIKQELIHA
jgi:F-type H+-transporting ATPase subunit delta